MEVQVLINGVHISAILQPAYFMSKSYIIVVDPNGRPADAYKVGATE